MTSRVMKSGAVIARVPFARLPFVPAKFAAEIFIFYTFSLLSLAMAMLRGIPASHADSLDERLRHFEVRTFPRVRSPVPGVVIPPRKENKSAADYFTRYSALNPPPSLIDGDVLPFAATRSHSAPPNAFYASLKPTDLPTSWDDKVIRYLDYYRNDPDGRAMISFGIRRLGRFEAMIRGALKRHGLPQALVYVAVIESAVDPTRTSRTGAAGIWQFMKSTGKAYGLRSDRWIDERRNPERSTEAALTYLKSLHRRLGSWELALAAYNAGFGAVVAAMQKYNTNDFWRLTKYEAGLPWASTLYVPKILATALISENYRRIGLGTIVRDTPRRFALVAAPAATTIKALGAATGVSDAEIAALNPELRRSRTPPGGATWLRVPSGSKEQYYRTLEKWRKTKRDIRAYNIRVGDTLQALAMRFGSSVRRLKALNGIKSTRDLHAGLPLIVPRRRREQEKGNNSQPTKQKTIAALPEGVPMQIKGKRRVFYRVVLGDTLSEIAEKLAVRTRQLIHWNRLDAGAKIVSKMILQAFVDPKTPLEDIVLLDPKALQTTTSGSENFLDDYERRKGRRRITYTVRTGDTLSRLSRRYGLSIGSISRINQFGRATDLRAGQKIVLYVEDRQAKRSR